MRFPLTDALIDEATRFGLKSACQDCFYWRARTAAAMPALAAAPNGDAVRSTAAAMPALAAAPNGDAVRSPGECWHEWPDEGQRRSPIDAPNADGTRPTEAAFCKEFELK